MRFDAPWGISLKLTTLFAISILAGVALIGILNITEGGSIWLWTVVILPLAILTGAAFFMIRGYQLTKDKLLVERLGWQTEVGLEDLQSVEIDPGAMRRSIRVFGNGGLFCFAGRFRNKRLGAYRAFATKPKLSVTMKFKDRIIVVTPDDPEAFVAQLKRDIAIA